MDSIRIYHRCGGCGKKQNGNRVDVWLIYRCKKCKHSWNLAIYERIKPSKIAQKDYELFMENDYALALKYGNDIHFLKRNNAEIK